MNAAKSRQRAHLVHVSPLQFEAFLDAVTRVVSAKELPEGVGELPGSPWPVSYAVARQNKFAAVRWYEIEDVAPTLHEAFFVVPASKPARAGYRIRTMAEQDLEQVPPAWWSDVTATDAAEIPASPEGSVPGFMELAVVLASRGDVRTCSADLLASLEEAQQAAEANKQMAQEASDEVRHLRNQLRQVLTSMSSLKEATRDLLAREERDTPRDLAELPAWCALNSERITVLARALNGAKKSLYQAPEHIFAGLEFLAGPYREHRRGEISLKAMEDALQASGCKLAGSASPTIAGEQGDAYFVNFNGRRRFLEFHLVRGGGRDERYCMRIYFFYDDATQKAVVGWLPSHLPNSLS